MIFCRINLKQYGKRGDSLVQEHRARAESIVEYNSKYTNKSRVIHCIIEVLINIVFTIIVLFIYFKHFFDIYNFGMKNGLLGLFLFILSLGIPAGLFDGTYGLVFDSFVNLYSIKKEKEKILEKIIIICVLSFILTLSIYAVIWGIEYIII